MHTYFLESPLTGSNGWPTIVVPSVPDPSLAPEGCHVLHATMTEPYAPWAALPRGGPEYERLKAERGDVLMGLVRQVRCACFCRLFERCVRWGWFVRPRAARCAFAGEGAAAR